MRKWSKEDTDWLIQNRTKGIDYCASHLGRTYGSISSRLNLFGIASNPRRRNETPVPKSSTSEATRCYLPVFHPVMVGVYPISLHIHKSEGSSLIWRKRRAIILKIHDYMCVYCGGEANTVDHVVPISKGGMDNLENLVAACQKCNYGMGNKAKHIIWIK